MVKNSAQCDPKYSSAIENKNTNESQRSYPPRVVPCALPEIFNFGDGLGEDVLFALLPLDLQLQESDVL